MAAIYLAAPWRRQSQMRSVRDTLITAGHTVTSRWLDREGDASTFTGQRWAELSLEDVDDLHHSTVVVLWSEPRDAGVGGGRHFWTGIAYGLVRDIILVGPRLHRYQHLPGIVQVDGYGQLLYALAVSDGLRAEGVPMRLAEPDR